MDNDNPPVEKKELPRWLDRLLTSIISTIIITLLAVPTVASKLNDMSANIVEIKTNIAAIREGMDNMKDQASKARLEDTEKIGNLAGRIGVVEKSLTLITMNKWNQPEPSKQR